METTRQSEPGKAGGREIATGYGSFRTILARARHEGPLEIHATTDIGSETRALTHLIETGERRLAHDIDAALEADAEALSAMAARAALQATMADLFFRLGATGEPAVEDLLLTLAELRRGETGTEQALTRLADALPTPEQPVRPRNLDEAIRYITGLVVALDLRQGALRIVASQGGATDKAAAAAERRVERQGVVLLGQLEAACAVADDTLRRRAADEGQDPDAVSSSLAAAFAARSRRVGYPVPIVVARPAGWRRPLRPLPFGQAGSPISLGRWPTTGWGRWLSQLGDWVASQHLPALPSRAALRDGLGRRSIWPVLTVILLALVVVVTWRAFGVAVRPITSALAGASTSATSAPRLEAGTSVRLVVRTTGRASLEEVATYFGMADPWAMSLLAWVNSSTLREFQAETPKGQFYTTPLPNGLLLEIPAMAVSTTMMQPAAATEYGVTVEGIRRLSLEGSQGVYLVPVGRHERLADARVKTEARDLDVRRPTFSVGAWTAVR